MRVGDHPVLGKDIARKQIVFDFEGEKITAFEDEPIAAALMAVGVLNLRYTKKRNEPRGVYCGIGRCTDCMVIVDGRPNVRACVTPVREGMKVERQSGYGRWGLDHG